MQILAMIGLALLGGCLGGIGGYLMFIYPKVVHQRMKQMIDPNQKESL